MLAFDAPADPLQCSEDRFGSLAGQLLIRNREGNAMRRGRKLTVGDAIGNDLDSETLSIADRFVPALAITHYTRKLKCLRDPAALFLPIQVDRQFHSLIIR